MPQQALVVDPKDVEAVTPPSGDQGRTFFPSLKATPAPLIVDPNDVEATGAPGPTPTPAPAPKNAPGQFLGDPTKPAKMTGPESTGDMVKRNVKAAGKAVYEGLPMVGGATGAMLGGTLSLPTAAVAGPAGPVTGALVGAGAGGALGRYAQMLIDMASGKAEPPPAAGKPPVSKVAQVGTAATDQMLQEMGGQVMAMPLGFIKRGAFTKMTPEVADTIAKNRAYGTNLSGPELTSGTRAGNIAKTIQGYAAGSFGGGELQREARAVGSGNAEKVLDSALKAVGTPASRTGAGKAAEAGLGGARAGLKATGEELGKVVENAPPLPMKDLKQKAYQVFSDQVLPLLKDFPDVAGNPKVAALLRSIKDNPDLIQRNPRPVMTQLADAILEKTNSPMIKTLRAIMGAGDEVSFKAGTQMRSMLRKAAAGEDGLMPKKDAASIAKLFTGDFTDALFKTSPDYARLSPEYGRISRGLSSKPLETIFKTAISEPESVVSYLKRDAPTRARLLREALLDYAGKGPDKDRAKAAYDVIRSTWWRDAIVTGGKATADLEGMAKRLAAADHGGVTKELFADPAGQQLLEHARNIADLMAKRTPLMSGNMRKIFEISRLASGAVGMMQGKSGAMVAGAVWEGIPDFFAWVIHDPKATKWFIEGVKAKNPSELTGATVRLVELFRRQHQPQQKAPFNQLTEGYKNLTGKVASANVKIDPADIKLGMIGGLPEGLNPVAIDMLLKQTEVQELLAEASPIAAKAAKMSKYAKDIMGEQMSPLRLKELLSKFGGTGQ